MLVIPLPAAGRGAGRYLALPHISNGDF